jgi:hypothetical protein
MLAKASNVDALVINACQGFKTESTELETPRLANARKCLSSFSSVPFVYAFQKNLLIFCHLKNLSAFFNCKLFCREQGYHAYHPEAGNPALKGGVFSKNGWGGVRIPSPTNQSRALRPGFQVLWLIQMPF